MKNAQTKSGRDYGIIQKKDKNGAISWYARIVRTDASGVKKQHTLKAENKSHARRLRDELAERYKAGGQKAISGDKLTFREFAEEYRNRKLIPAKYHQDRKIAGLRSHRTANNFLSTLVAHFGNLLLREVTPSQIERFKQKRLDTPISSKQKGNSSQRPRAIASVNRELALLRTILNDAIANGILTRSPFLNTKLVSLSDEIRRERVLTCAEEFRLLAACDETIPIEYERGGKKIRANHKSRRTHLRPLLITALDTAMRSGELLMLRWTDVDFDNRAINILAFNTKTARARTVGMTERVHEELIRLWEESPQDRDGSVFGIRDTVKRAFASACRIAEVRDFRFHDCRHTAITRMIQAGLAPMEVMKISGHTQMNTFARYVNPDKHAVIRLASLLTTFNEKQGGYSGQTESELLN